jgi:hypothetical protein
MSLSPTSAVPARALLLRSVPREDHATGRSSGAVDLCHPPGTPWRLANRRQDRPTGTGGAPGLTPEERRLIAILTRL